MKKTLAIAIVLVMVVSCLSVLFVSADEVESLKVDFTQLEGTSTGDCSLTLHLGDAEEKELKSGDVNLRWAYAMAIDANGTIVRVGQNLLSEAQDDAVEADYDNHGIVIPANGCAIVFHCGDGVNSSGNEELRTYFTELLAEAGVDSIENTVADVSAAGWQIADLTTEGGEWDYGSVTLYKGAAPAAGGDTTKPDEPKEPEIVEVEEVINVDGELNDTGWDKAEWVDNGFWQGAKEEEYPGDDITGKYAVRADENNIYIALEMNTIAPNTTAAYDSNKFGQSSASNIRIWFKKDAETRTFFDIQYNGTEFALANWNNETTIPSNGVASKVVYADGKLVAEISVPMADIGIEDSFYLLVTYSETYETGYNAIHFTTSENLNDPEGGDNAAYWAPGNTYSYTKYTVADLVLGTYEKVIDPNPTEPDEPEVPDTYEEDIAALVGTPRENPDFKINLAYEINEVDGKNVVTVTLTVTDIKEGVQPQSLDAKMFYDIERLTLLNGEVKDEIDGTIALDCVKTVPGASWENMTKAVLDEETKEPTGEITISFVGINPDHVLTAEAPIELTFNFELKEGFDKAGIYVTTESVESVYAENGGSSVTNYVGDGAYVIAKLEPKADDSTTTDATDNTTTETTGGTTPGDNGVLLFAVLGILAIAGAATVIKARN